MKQTGIAGMPGCIPAAAGPALKLSDSRVSDIGWRLRLRCRDSAGVEWIKEKFSSKLEFKQSCVKAYIILCVLHLAEPLILSS